jgi:hypothetical protein
MAKDIEVYALKFHQHGEVFYEFSLPADELIEVVEVIPNSDQHPDYPQRQISDARLRAYPINGYFSPI